MFKKISQEDIEDTKEEKLEDEAQELLNDAVSFVVDDIGYELHKVESLAKDRPVLKEIMDIIKSNTEDEFSIFDKAVDVIKGYAKRILFGGE